MNKAKRSPLKAPPLRQAGQSVEEEIQRLWDDEIAPYYFAAAFVIAMAAYEWWRWYTNSPPQPWLFTLIAVGFAGFFVRRFLVTRRRIRLLRRARDGERVVGQFLDGLREKGYRVLHDIVGEGFNIDHLLVGPHGIFTIETKTWSKPVKGEPKIEYDGEQLSISGLHPDRDPIVQARAQAKWIKDLVNELTGKSYFVRPVVVYPGWFINPLPKGMRADVWVLNPKALPAYLENERNHLGNDEVSSITAHLSRYVRNGARLS